MVKAFRELRPDDLVHTPVWHYEGKNDEVAIVSPTDRNDLSESESAVYIARTVFVLQNGSQISRRLLTNRGLWP